MSAQESIFSLVDPHSEVRRPSLIGMQSFYKRPVRSPDFGLARPRFKPQDFIGLLFRHRARLKMSAQPRVHVEISVFTPTGEPAIEIHF